MISDLQPTTHRVLLDKGGNTLSGIKIPQEAKNSLPFLLSFSCCALIHQALQEC